jgi:hypothetical protein
MIKLVFATVGMMLCLAGAASAQQQPPAGTVREACAADIQKLCPGMAQPDQHKCLMANLSKASQECGTAVANARSAGKEFQQACHVDIQHYCGTQPPGPQRHKCIVANQAQFSQPCQNALAAQHAPK